MRATRFPSVLLLGVALSAAGLAACGGGDDDAVSPQVGFASSTSALAQPSPSTTARAADLSKTTTTTTTTAPPTTTAAPPPPPAAAPSGDTGPQHFRSPTGNIGCYVSAEHGARCDISERSWSPPPKPASCDVDWGNALNVDHRRSQFICYGDTVQGGSATLAYGRTSRRGNFECSSAQSGMTCRNRATGRGFFLSRGSYRLF